MKLKQSSDHSGFKTLRERAEEKFSATAGQPMPDISPLETKKLLDEIRVQQIEIELQYEELNNTRDALLLAKKKYEDLFNIAPVGYLAVLENGQIIEANITAATMLGTEIASLATQNISKLIFKEDLDVFLLNWKRVFDGGNKVNFELRMKVGGGTCFWAHLAVMVVRSLTSNVVARITIIDISKARKTTEKLRISEANSFAILNSSPDTMFLLDRNGVVADANEVLAARLGVTRQDLIGQVIFPFLEPVIAAKRKENLERVLATGEPVAGEDVRDGMVNEYRIYPVKNSDGEVVYVAVYSKDITARRKSEDALRESEYKWRKLVSTHPDYIAIADSQGGYLFLNHFAEGYSEKDIMGKSMFDFIPAGSGDIFKTNFEHCVETGNTHQFEYQAPGKNREMRTYSGHFARLTDSSNVHTILSIARDITDEKRSAQLLQSSLNEILTYIVDKSEKLTDSKIGFLHFLNVENQTISLHTWSTNTINTFCEANAEEMHYSFNQAGVWTDCIRDRQPVILNDYANHPGKKGMPEGHVILNRQLTIPVIRNDKVVAVLGVGNKSLDYDNKDVETLLHFTNLAYDFIVSKGYEEELQKKISELERLNHLMVDRELKMTDLKEEINVLSNRLGEGNKYIVHRK